MLTIICHFVKHVNWVNFMLSLLKNLNLKPKILLNWFILAYPVISTSSHKFYISFLDDYNGFVWLYPFKTKVEVVHAFIQFKYLVEKQLGRRIKLLQSDGGGEFKQFNEITQREGIIFRHSCLYTSLQNGRVECKQKQIVEMGLTLLAQAHVPLHYWLEAFQTSIHLINKLSTLVLKGETPHFMLHKQKPKYEDFLGVLVTPALGLTTSIISSTSILQCVCLWDTLQHKRI